MKFRAVLVLMLLICAPALAQVNPGTTPLTIAKGGTAASTAAGARTNLGLGTIATQNANALNVTGATLLTGLPAPVNPSDAARLLDVQNAAVGITFLPSSSLAATAALPNTPAYANGTAGVGATLTAGANSTLTVDSTVAGVNAVVLVAAQASAFQNGIYIVTTAGSDSVPWVLTRVTYFNQSSNMLAGSTTLVTGGSTNAGKSYSLSATVTTVGTTAVTFNNSFSPGVTSIAGNPGAFTLQYPIGNSSNVLIYTGPTSSGLLAFSSFSTLTFTPFNGDMIRIAGVVYQIPSGGVAGCGNTSVFINGTGSSNLAASTLYYVYLFNNSGVLTCDFSTMAHSTDTTAGNVGTEIETGNNTRSLIGLITTNAFAQFIDISVARNVRSWFNRSSVALRSPQLGSNVAFTGSVSEISSTLRMTFVQFANEVVEVNCNCLYFSGVSGQVVSLEINYDGGTGAYVSAVNGDGTNAIRPALAMDARSSLAEGLHYATLFGASNFLGGGFHLDTFLQGRVGR